MTLYDQLGGEAAVSAAVQRFYVRVVADPILAPFFKGVNMARLKSHQFAFLSQALGGPQAYSGLEMAQAHALLSIEQRHFEAVAGHLVETLRELSVPPDLIDQVAAAVVPLAKQIVNTAGARA